MQTVSRKLEIEAWSSGKRGLDGSYKFGND